jgi:hypothetical protein
MPPIAFLTLFVSAPAIAALPAEPAPLPLRIARAPVLQEAPPQVAERAPPLDCTLYTAPLILKIKPKSPWQRTPAQIRITAVVTGVSAVYGGPDSLTLSGDFSIPESWPSHLSAQLPLPKPRESGATQDKAGKFFAPGALPAHARCSATFIIIHDKVGARQLKP